MDGSFLAWTHGDLGKAPEVGTLAPSVPNLIPNGIPCRSGITPGSWELISRPDLVSVLEASTRSTPYLSFHYNDNPR